MDQKSKAAESGTLEALADALAARVIRKDRGRAAFQIVAPRQRSTELFDSITRDHIYRRIRFLTRTYGTGFLVDQATFNKPALECLEDGELSALLQDLERARECIEEDVPFEHAGLIRRNQLPSVGG